MRSCPVLRVITWHPQWLAESRDLLAYRSALGCLLNWWLVHFNGVQSYTPLRVSDNYIIQMWLHIQAFRDLHMSTARLHVLIQRTEWYLTIFNGRSYIYILIFVFPFAFLDTTSDLDRKFSNLPCHYEILADTSRISKGHRCPVENKIYCRK